MSQNIVNDHIQIKGSEWAIDDARKNYRYKYSAIR